MPTSTFKRIVPKATAYSPSVATDRSGTVITNRDGAGNVVYTLPTPTRAYLGFEYEFCNLRDFNMTIQGTTAGDVCTFNNAAATSVAASTAGQKIGARMRALCVETVAGTFKWLVSGISVSHTYTVA